MAYKGKKFLAVIPARGGSKGIPKKNLAEVGGISLIGHTGVLCSQLEWLDNAILSTDDESIKKEGEKHSLEVPFLRPPELSSDSAHSMDVWKHAFLYAEDFHGVKYDFSLLLEPSSPLRTIEDIASVVNLLTSGPCHSVVTVSSTPAHFTPHKTLRVNDSGKLEFFLQNGQDFSLRQTIPRYFHRNGICYGMSREMLVSSDNAVLADISIPLIIDRPVVNIDDVHDLETANWIYSRKSG